MTGVSFLRGFVGGDPWTTPFETLAARLPREIALRACDRANERIGGFSIVPAFLPGQSKGQKP